MDEKKLNQAETSEVINLDESAQDTAPAASGGTMDCSGGVCRFVPNTDADVKPVLDADLLN